MRFRVQGWGLGLKLRVWFRVQGVGLGLRVRAWDWD